MTADFLTQLRADRLVTSPDARLTPLTGGVSSEIYRVQDGEQLFVIKRALAKLKVRDDWFADTGRVRFEVAYLRYVGDLLPGAVPSLLATGDGYFAMEFLGDGFENWKSLLLAGDIRIAHAAQAGSLLGTVHQHSTGDRRAKEEFASQENFKALRIDPYLRTTGERHPSVRDQFEAEASRLEGWQECLVHGDFSPKNILIAGERMVVLDCEVACYGDPAFDLAFLLNHFFLKAIYRCGQHAIFADMVQSLWSAYLRVRALEPSLADALEGRVVRLLPMLMLARVDGKSPAEYLTETSQKDAVRGFVLNQLASEPTRLDRLTLDWLQALNSLAHSS